MKGETHRLRPFGAAAMLLALSGCSMMGPSAVSSRYASASPPPPLVQNCGLIAISTPSRFVCNGKVYTTFELLKLREDWEKKMAKMSEADNAPTKLASGR